MTRVEEGDTLPDSEGRHAARTLPLTPSEAAGPTGSRNAAPATVAGTSLRAAAPAFSERYTSVAPLGAGGMGEVNTCRDVHVGRNIAVKTLRPELHARPMALARFLREARVQGQLEHPAIVPVYDIGARADGTPYFTMKRVRGTTLEAVIEQISQGDAETRARYSLRKLLTAFLNVCMAVDYAHERGVLHRDLKPANVMLGDWGEVYVLDWGLAKIEGSAEDELVSAISSESGDSTHATRDGEILGTPGYMSPEQLRGEFRTLDRRADVYALGVILFEILTFTPLHPRGNFHAVMASVFGATERSPSSRASGRDVAPELDRICVRATAPAADDRPASVGELVNALERYLDGDRDTKLRETAAETHAAAAERAAKRTLAADATEARTARAEALREVGRALAMQPEHPRAYQTLIELLVEPPKELPTELAEELDRERAHEVRVGGRSGAFAYLSFFLYAPILYWMGIRSPLAIATTGTLFTLAAAASFLEGRLVAWRRASQYLSLAASTAAMGSVTPLFGPFVLVPLLCAVNTLGFALNADKRDRVPFVLMGAGGVAIPAVLALLGLIDGGYAFTAGALQVNPGMTELPALPTMVFLAASSLVVPATAAYVVGDVRDVVLSAERRLRVMTWQLRQLAGVGTPGTKRA